MKKRNQNQASQSAGGTVRKEIVGSTEYSPRVMAAKCRRKTVTTRDVLQAIADAQVANLGDPTCPWAIWNNRCLKMAAEMIEGKDGMKTASKKRVTVYLSPYHTATADRIAKARGLTRSALIEKLMADAVAGSEAGKAVAA